jgi:hypothetical protein
MKESIGLLIKAVDGFGFLSEDFGFDLVGYEYNSNRPGYFKLTFESRDIRVCMTLEKNQLFIHFASLLYPDEWHSMLRFVRYIVRKGGSLTNDEQDTDYWRQGMKPESQFAIAGRQLERTLPCITQMLSGNALEATRVEIKNYGRQTQAENNRIDKQ